MTTLLTSYLLIIVGRSSSLLPKPERDRPAASERGESKPSRSSNGSSKRSDSSSGQQQQQMGSGGFGPFNPNVGFGPMGAQYNNPFDPASSSSGPAGPSPFLNPNQNPFWSNTSNNPPHMPKSSQGSSSSRNRGSRMDRSRNSDSRSGGGGGGGGWNR